MDSYELIHLEEYNQTGAGGTALSYTHKTRNTLVKLYNPGFEADRAMAEFHTAQAVFDMGIPTPKPYRLVTDGERFGAEYELIKNKRSFTRIISEEPERLEEISCTQHPPTPPVFVPIKKSSRSFTRKRTWFRRPSNSARWHFWKKFRIHLPACTETSRSAISSAEETARSGLMSASSPMALPNGMYP